MKNDPVRQTHIKALVCAAGVGRRMGAACPKQYLRLGERTMLAASVRALAEVSRVEEIVVVVSPGDPYIDTVKAEFPSGVRVLACGGAERAESVRNGLTEAGFAPEDWVLVHDGARPCLKPSEAAHLIDAVLSDSSVAGGLLAMSMTDTVKRVDDRGVVIETIPRGELRRAATPQLFRAGALIAALSGELGGITDEASAFERAGQRVLTVPCRTTNIKVTEPADAELARFILGEQTMVPLRVGQGYDSHRLVEGRPLVIGGVTIPFELGLDGHSDADVLLHAVTDAVLGAACLGDIGQHFPPSDPKWKGADSRELLKAVVALAAQKGWAVVNCDATVVAERPKFAPHMPAIRQSVSACLGVSADDVNVKAKTNEKMDAVGHLEGMMAQAVVLMARR